MKPAGSTRKQGDYVRRLIRAVAATQAEALHTEKATLERAYRMLWKWRYTIAGPAILCDVDEEELEPYSE